MYSDDPPGDVPAQGLASPWDEPDRHGHGGEAIGQATTPGDGVTPEVPAGKLIILAAGDTVYVFDEQWKADMQYMVCVGANLDVQVWRLAPHRWVEVRRELEGGDDGIAVVEARTVSGPESADGH